MGDEGQSTAALLASATSGFDGLFSGDLVEARSFFSSQDSPFHLLGQGVCAFLEAALGMETGLMSEATRCLTLAEAGARKQVKASKYAPSGRLAPGLEWEVLHADAVVLLGLTQALSESYMGYLQCMYSLNSAHSKFSKLYKQIFPNGLESYTTPSTSLAPSRNVSTPSLASSVSSTSTSRSFFSRWGSSFKAGPAPIIQPDGPVDELIVSGVAFGYGLFNLILSLLPAKVKTVVGFFGYGSDRKTALQALAVSANRQDVHAVFAGLALMTYHGVVLLMTGYQADEEHIVKQYRAIVDKTSARYPDGALWILNQAKILRMTGDPGAAVEVLRSGLDPKRPNHFQQADALLVFELAWTLLSQRRYQEAANMFLKVTEMNSWSHATYYMIAAGCYISLNNQQKAKQLLDHIPGLIERKKIGGKDLPTEIFIKKKIAFYKEKQGRRGGKEEDYVDCIRISPAEELAIFWNTHDRISKEVAEGHIAKLTSMSPAVAIQTPYARSLVNGSEQGHYDDLDTPDELAIRSLILGIVHRSIREYEISREFLEDALQLYPDVEAKWIGGIASFELAVLDLKEADYRDKSASAAQTEEHSIPASAFFSMWEDILDSATERLNRASDMSGANVDLSTRLDSRIAMLRDEIALKRAKLGLSG